MNIMCLSCLLYKTTIYFYIAMKIFISLCMKNVILVITLIEKRFNNLSGLATKLWQSS